MSLANKPCVTDPAYDPALGILVPGNPPYSQITEEKAAPLERPASAAWWGTFLFSGSLLALCMPLIACTIFEGIGVWGPNRTVGRGFGITNFVFWIGIGHAGALISAILLLLRARWCTSIARAAEVMANNHLVHGKAAWLNAPSFFIRTGAILAIWFWMISALGKSIGATIDAPSAQTRRNLVKKGALSLVLLALTTSAGFWDWAMSLEPEWFSTMYGVYGFAGAFQGGIVRLWQFLLCSAIAQGMA